MKPFEEFWNSVTNEEIMDLANNANSAIADIISNTENPENLIGNQIVMVSLSITHDILKRYHEWISENQNQFF